MRISFEKRHGHVSHRATGNTRKQARCNRADERKAEFDAMTPAERTNRMDVNKALYDAGHKKVA